MATDINVILYLYLTFLLTQEQVSVTFRQLPNLPVFCAKYGHAHILVNAEIYRWSFRPNDFGVQASFKGKKINGAAPTPRSKETQLSLVLMQPRCDYLSWPFLSSVYRSIYCSTVWNSEIGSLTSLDAPESLAFSDIRRPISLHQAVSFFMHVKTVEEH